MTEAEQAFEAAKEEIARATAAGGTVLLLNSEAYFALDRIPEEIAQLSDLQGLYLDNTQVSDITPLAQLSNLQVLFLNDTQVSDITPLAQLSNLRTLYLSNTQVSDITPLAQLSNLQTLDLRNTQVSNITPLAQLANLQVLFLDNTQVSDIAPLAQLSNLRTLYLSNTRVSDVTPLAQLANLQYLTLSNTQVSDITPLAQLANLRTLYHSNTQVSDIAPLAQLSNLQVLFLNNTQVSDLRPVSGLPELVGSDGPRGLWFANTPATKRDPELRRLSEIEDDPTRTRETLAYLNTLPPYPEPLPWLVQTKAAQQRTPKHLKRLSLSEARHILENNYPLVRERCQAVVHEIDEGLAIQNTRIPNDARALAEHMQVTQSLELAKAAMIGIHEALPEGFTDQKIDEETANRFKQAFDSAIDRLQSAAAYIDRPDHTPTFGGLLKMGCAGGVASVLAFAPGVTFGLALPAVYGLLYGPGAVKALNGIVSSKANAADGN